MRITRQYDAMDCGPSCVRMMVSAHGMLFPLAQLRRTSCLAKFMRLPVSFFDTKSAGSGV